MRWSVIPAALAASLMLAAAPLPPALEWKKEIGEANIAWSKKPHAILKIQDAAYLGEGQSATLTGTSGKPASFKWVPGKQQDGILWVTYKGGKMSGAMHGKPIDDATFLRGVAIEKNIDLQGFPTQVSAGVMGVRVMLYNQLRADALNFKGVDYFPYDPSYRVTATFKPDPKRPARVFRTSRGTDKQFYLVGSATFTLKGKTFTLPFYAGDNDPKKITDMSSFFMDDLTGKVTYGAGRYVDVADFGKYPPKTVTIDFNFAYNPNCARSPFYTCPVATDVLAMEVRAGEKDPHHAH
ncbi:MAG: DUF1684 domain-containing protein [Alphaproteobacteria bacterium]|nr:DUF1684 domain-containing protein [Alphaproteobacteria bacterium]MBV9420405.1 DUF1684 domain-containing protein [Alphaproteobacteria bacterium]MBV9542473.1 DUF1684 domain-containing protein [Alphaproteobacteria bacterium]MBV9903281.1 DUF1684 domain-containing protein [Alphaproteobacteria bacterium]